MPKYDFICKTCDLEFEFFKLRSNERVKCPQCGEDEEKKIEKQVSKGTGFSLKGKGWYRDKYS